MAPPLSRPDGGLASLDYTSLETFFVILIVFNAFALGHDELMNIVFARYLSFVSLVRLTISIPTDVGVSRHIVTHR